MLEELALDYPLPKVILEYRGLAKLKSTYTDKLPLMINPKRAACIPPIIRRSPPPAVCRLPIQTCKTFRCVTKKGAVFAGVYRAGRLRHCLGGLLANRAAHYGAPVADKGLLTAFAEGKDIHRATAAEVFGLPLDSVSSEQRRSAKAINFGLIYGMSAFGWPAS